MKDLEMENNDLLTFPSIKDRKEWILDIDQALEPQSECCIYRVPKEIRKMNEEAYTPQVISIGPLYHGKPELLAMEKQKIRFVKQFCKRIREETWQEFINFIEREEQRIRNCYAEMRSLNKLKFITMILYDAIFIIEYLVRWCEGGVLESDFLFKSQQARAHIWKDLQLLENQLPYFVLDGLYKLAFFKSNQNGEEHPSLFSLSCRFFSFDTLNCEVPKGVEVKHFTDLVRRRLIEIEGCQRTKGFARNLVPILDIPCAVKLQESGVKFRKGEGGCLLDVSFRRKKRLIPFPLLEESELNIPRINIFEGTESLFRNLMAFEQCHYPNETYVCNFICLMDALIDTEKDVDLLVEGGIICNYAGDNATVANMFNKISDHIILSADGYYVDALNGLVAHYRNPWNLRKVFFKNLMTGTGTIAATLGLVLTAIGTICSILQVL